MDYPSETALYIVAPSSTVPQTPLLRFFLRGGAGAAVHRLPETDNASSNCPSKLRDKVRRIIHSNEDVLPI